MKFKILSTKEAKDYIISDKQYLNHCTEHYKKEIGVQNGWSLEKHLQFNVLGKEEAHLKIMKNLVKESEQNENLQKTLSLFFSKDEEVNIIFTTGQDNIGLPYTLNKAILIPSAYHFPPSPLGFVNPELLVHECWHIISRTNPELRDKAYKSLGFEKEENIEITKELKKLNLSEEYYFINPDAINNNYIYKTDAILDKNNNQYNFILPFLSKGMSSAILIFDEDKNILGIDSLSKSKEYTQDFNIGYNNSIEEVCAELLRAKTFNHDHIYNNVKDSQQFYKTIFKKRKIENKNKM